MPAAQRLFDLPSRDDLDCLPDPMEGIFTGRLAEDGLFDLQAGVGAGQTNGHADVSKLQALLHLEGYLDAAVTNGPTGLWSGRDDYALRKFQKENGLVIDGIVLPGGETLEAIRGFSQ